MKKAKQLIGIAILSATLVSVSACKNEKSNTNATADHDTEATASNEQVAPITFKNATVNNTFKHYIQLKSALVKGNAEAAKKEAKMISGVCEVEKIKEISAEIASENDIKNQRELLSDLTTALKPVLVANIVSGEVYEQHCPMALNDGANWFATEKEVNNPYYGDAMLHCGLVQETIK